MKVGQNLKSIRKRKGLSQGDVAQALGFIRSTYSGYENGIAQPSIDGLCALSEFYCLSIDELIKEDFSTFTESDWQRIEQGNYADAQGHRLRVLTTTVNQEDEELIELIPQKASAGYTNGYSDPDYLKVLPTFTLPFLSKDKKYRSFPIKGDSMPPVMEGSFVIGEYIPNWTHIRNETPCIVVTKDEGILFKIVNNQIASDQALQLCSTNPFYPPYLVAIQDVLEIWKFVNYISPALPEIQIDPSELAQSIVKLQQEVLDLKRSLVPQAIRPASEE